MSGLSVVVADSAELKREVYRFRYQVYVEQMRRRQTFANHDTRSVEEPMDQTGLNYIAFLNEEPVGVIRSNTADDAAASYYNRLYKVNLFESSDPSKIQITTKLMVRPDLQNTVVGPRMIQHYAEQGYRRGIRVDLLDCNKHLIRFFTRLGYFSYTGWAFHKEYGTVRPMMLAVDTLEYMRAIKSILAKPASLITDGIYDGYNLVRRLVEPPSDNSVLAEFRDFFRDQRAAAE